MATFLGLIEGLIGDPAEKAAYAADPDNYLSSHGFGDLDSEDVSTALAHAADAFPPRLAAVIDPDAGLAPVADVDLGQLGLSGFDDYAAPSDDDVGGAEGAELGDAPHDGDPTLHRDVDIDIDGDGIPDAPARTADDATEATDASDATAGDRADAAGERSAADPTEGDDVAAPGLGATADPLNDPWADPGLGLDDAPWMDQRPDTTGLETVEEPTDDILDDVDEHLGQ